MCHAARGVLPVVHEMLWRLLRTYLAPFPAQIAGIVAFQLLSTVATLLLPSINGDIIDNGVATGDTGYILRQRRGHAGRRRPPRSRARSSRSTSARGSRWRYGRDLRGAIFHHVGRLSAREVGKFGAPSLITRTTNDVQQVQMLVLMSATMLVTAPIMCVGGIVMALREDLGLSRLLAVCIPALAGSPRLHHRADGPAVPPHAAQDRRGQPRAARADHRHARRPRVRPRARRGGAVRRRQRRAHRARAPRRQAAGADVPDRDARVQRVAASRCCGSAAIASRPARSRSAR